MNLICYVRRVVTNKTTRVIENKNKIRLNFLRYEMNKQIPNN